MKSREKKKSSFLKNFFVFLSVVLVGFYFYNRSAEAAWFDDTWRYRVAIPISAHTSLEQNVYLSLTGSDGIDTTDTTKFQTDCGDIRFVTEGGEILPYYLTTACGLAQTGFQVFFESFPSGAQNIYYYYGNPSAPNGFSPSAFATVATGVTLGTRGSETNSPFSPIAYYRLDEGTGQVVNSSINTSFAGTLGPDATVTSTDPAWQNDDLCIVGKCLRFTSGSSQYVNVSSSLAVIKSVSFWVKPTSITTSFMVLNGSGGNASIAVSSGTISTGAGFTSPTIYVNGKISSTIQANIWQHVVITTGTGITGSNIILGRVSSGYLNGFMDEVKMYGEQITLEQVKVNYTSGLSKQGTIKGTSVNFGSSASTNALSNGLVGYWKLDEATWGTPNCSTDVVFDSSGNSNNGDACPNSTGPVGGNNGKFGSAVTFDGSDDYLLVPDSTSLDVTTNFTMSAWIYPTSVTGDQYILSKDGVGTDTTDAYGFFVQSGGEICYETNNRGNNFCSPTEVVNLNQWNHVVAVFDDAQSSTEKVKFFVNGVEQARDGDITQAPINVSTNLLIGRRGNSGDEFTGTIDELRIYNRSLSSSEVGSLYNWAPGPVGYWNMDENTGQAVNDKSGTGNNATLGTTSSVSTDDPSWSIGKFGSGLLFDGSTDLVRADDSDSLSFGNGTTDRSFTMSGWINPTVGTSQYVFTKFTEYEMRFGSDGRLICSQQDASTGGYIGRNWSGPVSTNTWFHVSCTYDGSATSAGTKIYVNGVRVDNANEASGSYVAMENTTNSFRLADALFTGRMDDMKVYNYVRSPAQVIEDMNGGRPASSSFSPVAYWKLDDATGTTASDASGNSLNLTLSTASWTSGGKFQSAWNGEGARWLSITDANTSGKLDFAAADDFTISMWMKSDSASNPVAVEYLLSKAESTAGYRMFVENDGTGSVSFGIDDDASWTPGDKANSVIDVYDGAWHNIVAVKQGTSKIQLFVDGNLKQEDTAIAESGTLENSITMYLGDRNGANEGDEFFGDLDEVKIFRSALTAEQIKLLYNQSAGSALGALSTDSLDVPSNSSTDEHCPPGQGSTCTPPILYWKLDENTGTSTTNDSSTNGYTGTLNGSMTNGNWVTGKLGSALNFDGVDDSVQNTSVSPPTGDFTYEAWIYPTTFATSNPIFGIPQASIGGNELMVDTDTDGDIDVLLDNGALLINGTNGLVAANSWSHIAVTRIGSTVTTYINGKRDGTGTDADALSIAPCGIRIGRSQTSTTCSSGGSALFAGRIDDVKVYDYGRTAAQVAWDYNRGKPVAWWKMDENTGSPSTINDSAGNSLSGTATGTMDSTDWVSGKLNTALDFDGSDDVVTLTNSSPIDLNTGLFSGFTFSTWIYPNTVGETAGRIFQKGTNGSTTDASTTFCRITGSSPFGVECNLDLATSDAVFSVSSAAPANQWTHIAFSWTNDSDDEVTIWVNGNPKTSTASYDGDPSAESNSLYVAGNGTTTSNTRAFDGQIDDFRIYNFELSAQQIKSAMNDGGVRMGPSTGTP